MTTPAPQSGIVLENVSKSFMTREGELEVIKDLSFEVAAGESVAVVGPSGSGKTTLLNRPAGVRFPTGGEIVADADPITGPHPHRGVIFQQYAVFPFMTVFQNAVFGLTLGVNHKPKEERERIAHRYIELMGLKG